MECTDGLSVWQPVGLCTHQFNMSLAPCLFCRTLDVLFGASALGSILLASK